MSGFLQSIRCTDCDALHERGGLSAEFYSVVPRHVCGECGNGDFYPKVERWVSQSVWYKPSTWGNGYWESRK